MIAVLCNKTQPHSKLRKTHKWSNLSYRLLNTFLKWSDFLSSACCRMEPDQIQEQHEKRIVALAVDGSAHAENALKFYLNQLRRDDDFLVLIHCPEMYELSNATPGVANRLIKEKKDQIEALETKYMTLLKESGVNIPGKVRIESGKPGHAICKIAEEEKAALIVCGTRGQGTIRRTIMGSVSDYIVHHSHVPVLICRQPKH